MTRRARAGGGIWQLRRKLQAKGPVNGWDSDLVIKVMLPQQVEHIHRNHIILPASPVLKKISLNGSDLALSENAD